MTDKIVVMSSCGSAAEAGKIAESLVEKRLAACVSILAGAQSVYRWQGAMERTNEFLLIIKSTRPLFAELRKELLRIHSYEMPEVLALPVVDGSASYLEWIDREVVLPSSQ